MAIVVSLAPLEEKAASVVVKHFNIHQTEPEQGYRWVKLKLPAAFHPAIVIPFDNVSVKDRALPQLLPTSRFNFLEEKSVQLDAFNFREGIAKEPIFILGSAPLKSLALLDESLRAFFWYEGIISKSHLITEQVRDMTKRTVRIRNNYGYHWVQKCTVTKAGNGDQEIRAEPVETCSICPRDTKPSKRCWYSSTDCAPKYGGQRWQWSQIQSGYSSASGLEGCVSNAYSC